MNKGINKAILLAGGSGSRWYPTSLACSKHLFPVHDKPMIYYPLATLIECGVKEILIIAKKSDIPSFETLFSNGSELGLKISYKIQPEPEGIAQAITIAADFIGQSDFALMLGDNLFSSNDNLVKAFPEFQSGAHIFVTEVANPGQFGILNLDSNGSIKSIKEKPLNSQSNLAIVGLYLYDSCSIKMVQELQPSGRGEYEISGLNSAYLQSGHLTYSIIPTDCNWFDCGDPKSIRTASDLVSSQDQNSFPIGCVETAAYQAGRINQDQLDSLIQRMPDSLYRSRLTEWLRQAL